MVPYPLQFKALLKERVWGGRQLERYGLEMPHGAIGEGWMIGDHPNGVTQVTNGELAGMGLDEICKQYGSEILGAKANTETIQRFPLLIKLLDCEDNLSIQVHPGNDYTGLPEGELGKTEMWYILDAKPDAKIIYGLQDTVTRESLAEAIEHNRIMDCLQEVPVAAGDSFYIPAGTVHALCAGVLVAEIQQNSDTTYRLFDYNRLGLDGKLRDLHIEDSLNVIAYEGAGATRMTTELSEPNQWLTLASSPYFIVEKGCVENVWKLNSIEESFSILIICEGIGSISWGDHSSPHSLPHSLPIKPGDCFLLPANLSEYQVAGRVTLLRSYLP